jgi:hypothetical protein
MFEGYEASGVGVWSVIAKMAFIFLERRRWHGVLPLKILKSLKFRIAVLERIC